MSTTELDIANTNVCSLGAERRTIMRFSMREFNVTTDNRGMIVRRLFH